MGNVQVISESNPNPLAAIRKTVCKPTIHSHPPHSKDLSSSLLPCENPIMLLDGGQSKGVEMITVRRGPLNLYKFSSAKMNVEEGADGSLQNQKGTGRVNMEL